MVTKSKALNKQSVSDRVLVLLKFGQFSPERKGTGNSGVTETEAWIGNFNFKAWKTAAHKLHKSGAD